MAVWALFACHVMSDFIVTNLNIKINACHDRFDPIKNKKSSTES